MRPLLTTLSLLASLGVAASACDDSKPKATPRPAPAPKPAIDAAPTTPLAFAPAPSPAADGRVFEEGPKVVYAPEPRIQGAGRVRGRVVWGGAAPRGALGGADGGVARVGGERLVLGPGGGVANAIVSLVGLSRGRAVDPKVQVALALRDGRFEPHVTIVPLGGELVLSSADDVLHAAHAFLGARTIFNVGLARAGVEIPRRLRDAGLLEVRCDAAHPAESAYVLVASHPYHAVSDAQGGFELRDVPPGELRVRAWHEGWRAAKRYDDGRVDWTSPSIAERSVTVGAGETATVELTLTEDRR